MNDDGASPEEIRNADPGDDDAEGDAEGVTEPTAAEPIASPSPSLRPPKPRRPGSPLRVALVLTLAGVALLAGWYAVVYAKRAALLRIQQACLSYAPPTDTVVYEENPTRAADLL